MERRLRLRREAEVRQVRSRGRAFAEGPLVVRVLPNALEPAQNRYAVVAGKKAGGSVQRNRLKRLVREALRQLDPALRPGHDLVIVIRGDVQEMPSYAVARATLDRIVARAGLIAAATASTSPVDEPSAAQPGASPRGTVTGDGASPPEQPAPVQAPSEQPSPSSESPTSPNRR